MLDEEIEIGHKDLVTLEEDQDERDFTNEDRAKFQEWKINHDLPPHLVARLLTKVKKKVADNTHDLIKKGQNPKLVLVHQGKAIEVMDQSWDDPDKVCNILHTAPRAVHAKQCNI